VDGVLEGDPTPRLLVTIDNFAQLMNVSVRMDNLEPMTVWVPEAFLPRGLIEELDGVGGPGLWVWNHRLDRG